MAISVRQALIEGKTEPERQWGRRSDLSGLSSTERLFIEKSLLQMYPRLQGYDLIPWKWFCGPLIPDFLVRHTDSRMRRIVEIGCGDGVLSNLLSLLFPMVEIIGIDPDPGKIADARATIRDRQNIRFVRGNATVLSEIPCDRIIFNNCLANAPTMYAFKKLVMKTSEWIVDEGDFIIKESPLSWLLNTALLKDLAPHFRNAGSVETCLTSVLTAVGHHPVASYAQAGVLGLPGQQFLQLRKRDVLSAHLPETALLRETLGEWQDLGTQTNDSLLGFLFSAPQADFSRELV